MFRSWMLIIAALPLAMLTAGCQTQTSQPKPDSSAQKEHDHANHSQRDAAETDAHADEAVEAKVSSILGKLSPEDRQLAESQRFCAVMNHQRLGGMGAPLKLDIKGQPVFLCCKGCRAKALKKPDETLAKAAELKTMNPAAHH